MGQKDISTVVFNIVLHVIFLKLFFELEKVSFVAIVVILLTIAISYMSVAIFSSPAIGKMFDPDLVGIGKRSVFQLLPFLSLIGSCLMVMFIEYVVLRFRR